MTTADFLRDLPCYNKQSFSNCGVGGYKRPTSSRQARTYISSFDYGTPQVITQDKTNVLLRYLKLQQDAVTQDSVKRKHEDEGVTGEPANKAARVQPEAC